MSNGIILEDLDCVHEGVDTRNMEVIKASGLGV